MLFLFEIFDSIILVHQACCLILLMFYLTLRACLQPLATIYIFVFTQNLNHPPIKSFPCFDKETSKKKKSGKLHE